ncbi:MAG: hypothetical protein HC805_08625 [Alkalinema sp. RL_2_19]|nr:hypothetical protein [Alkalinema sp. RL_2_19]
MLTATATRIERIDLPTGRVYRTPVGEFPSVNEILTATMPESERAGLDAWRARVGDEVVNQVREAAKARGTLVHQLVEFKIQTGETPEIPASVSNFWKALEDYLPTADQTFKVNHAVYGGERLALELPLYHAELAYGGTFDWCGDWRGDGQIWLMDFKTSHRSKGRADIQRHRVQLAAYGMAMESLLGITCDRYGIILSRPSGSPQQFFFSPGEMAEAQDLWLERLAEYRQLIG